MPTVVLMAFLGLCVPAEGASLRCLPQSIRAALARVERACGPVRVISTFRRGAIIAGTRRPSYHRWCRAADITTRRPGCVYRALAGWWPGGLSRDYARVRHFHIDNGRRLRFVHGGRRSRYAKRARRVRWGG